MQFARLGAEIIDTDQIARELTGPHGVALPAIVEAFGNSYMAADGSLDRVAMRRCVFADAEARRRLEAILHPLILEVVRERLSHSHAPYVVLVVPLLVEVWEDYRDLVDRVLVVDCDAALQLRRVMARDGIEEKLARAMLAAQSSRADRLDLADDVLDNRAGWDELARQVETLHAQYLKLAKAHRDSLPGPG